jgi:hypothetical protein
MEQKIKILKDEKDYYIAEIEGNPVKLIKIDLKELQDKHENDLYLASTHLEEDNINDLLFLTHRLIQNTPNVIEYETVACELTAGMNKLYNKLKPHKLSHLMHNLIKETDPTIYGKAQTIMKQIHSLHYTLQKINEYINE